MPKRRSTRAFGGGTGDVNPQWFSTSVVASAADTTTSISVSSPPGIGLSAAGKPLAMELLKAQISFEQGTAGLGWMPTAASFAPGAGTIQIAEVRLTASSKNFGTTVPTLSLGDATVFLQARETLRIYESTAASTLATFDQGPIMIDLTDGAGNGLLYANQNIFFQISASNTNIVPTARIKLLYREKYITQQELLGLVLQSNQN